MKKQVIVDTDQVSRILICGVQSIGDAVMSLPAVVSLVEAFPDYEVELLAPVLTAPIYQLAVRSLRVCVIEQKGCWSILRALYSCKKRYVRVVLLSGGFVWALAAFIARIPVRVGLRSDWRSLFLTHAVRIDLEKMHGVDSYLKVAQLAVGFSLQSKAPSITLKDDLRCSAEKIVGDSFAQAGGYFTVSPLASNLQKSWPLNSFAQLCKGIIEKTGLKCVLLGAAADRAYCERLRKMVDLSSLVNCAGQSTLSVTAALLERAVFHVGNNSGLAHLAAAVGTRVVCISGAANLVKTGPYGEQHLLLGGISGSATRAQKRNEQKLLAAITVDQVYAALSSHGIIA